MTMAAIEPEGIAAMYETVTKGIRVRVEPAFLEDQSEPERGRYFWSYTIEVANQSLQSVQLVSRYWRITDAQGRIEEVRGAGVVGETPRLNPGEAFRYTSGCPLTTPSGIMVGRYQMITSSGKPFEIDIPAFSLDSPHGRRSVN